MQFVKEAVGLDVEPIRKLLRENPTPFKPSEVYNVAEDRKHVNKDMRRSVFRSMTDAKLFDAAQELVAAFAAQDKLHDWFLFRNDVTEIHYSPGDFFRRHQDYLSITSNALEECTMIVCITPDKEAEGLVGGETVLHLSSSLSHASKATTTPGGAICFRKDINHECKPITAGAKQIVTLNLWLVPKDRSRVLLITFPSEAEAVDDPDVAKIEAAHNSRSCAVSIDAILKQFPDSLLAGHVRFADSKGAAEKILAKDLGLPYVTFRIVFGEGRMEYGGEMYMDPPASVKNLPLWVSFGDCDNILLFRCLGTTGSLDPIPFDKMNNMLTAVPKKVAELLEKGELLRIKWAWRYIWGTKKAEEPAAEASGTTACTTALGATSLSASETAAAGASPRGSSTW
ncbi:hypothetical protein DFJ74DRAFT_717457 [Hyaloraphidium curvatum]|nr:hypothetical protein DFJ74DRAFT_717457 [Hyaloraphidium curvatum]